MDWSALSLNLPVFETALLTVYFLVLVILSVYGTHRFRLAYLYRKHRDFKHPQKEMSAESLPKVTVQLPIYNEMYVAKRLVQAACQIDYPKELLHIQVLDDSTDETTSILAGEVRYFKKQGFNIDYLHRVDRVGYKAGALEAGLKQTDAPFVAVFDADFIPKPSFLRDAMPYFATDNVGMVQIRWDHINRNYSLLTQAQSVLLDGHFVVEHTARNRAGCFFNFNGTAGIWRKETIFDAGGWDHDTLTEDLDLSYRAQLKGWDFVYVPDQTAPAEVPVEMNSFKSQQHRWAKGSIQTAIKLLPTIFRSSQPFKVKYEAFMHLTANSAYFLMVLLAIMMPMALLVRLNHSMDQALIVDLPVFIMATFSVINFYMLSQKEIGISFWQRTKIVPWVLALGMGLCINNCKAVLEALFGMQSGFVRTPKHMIESGAQSWLKKRYRARKTALPFIELAFSGYYVWAIYVAAANAAWYSIPFLLLFLTGFLYAGFMSLFQGVIPEWADIKNWMRPANTEVQSH